MWYNPKIHCYVGRESGSNVVLDARVFAASLAAHCCHAQDYSLLPIIDNCVGLACVELFHKRIMLRAIHTGVGLLYPVPSYRRIPGPHLLYKSRCSFFFNLHEHVFDLVSKVKIEKRSCGSVFFAKMAPDHWANRTFM